MTGMTRIWGPFRSPQCVEREIGSRIGEEEQEEEQKDAEEEDSAAGAAWAGKQEFKDIFEKLHAIKMKG